LFHAAPNVWCCGKAVGTELTGAPHWTSTTGAIALSKNAATMTGLLGEVTQPLTLQTVAKLATVAYTDLGIPPFSGEIQGDAQSGEALKHKYCLVTGIETWERFQFDPWLLNNRPINMNIVTEAFTGDLFGRFTAMVERHPLHFTAAGTAPAPEGVEANATLYDFRRTKPNTDYTSLANSPFAVSWLVGGETAKAINVGPPPRDFQGMTMKEFASLNWSGKAHITTNILVNSLNQVGAAVLDTNKYGDYLQMIADAVMGIMPVARHNIIPILHLRARPA